MNPDDDPEDLKFDSLVNCGGYDFNYLIKSIEEMRAESDMKMKGFTKENFEKHVSKDFDVSSSLPADALAKLTLVHGDCVVIPKDKLKEYIEKCNN